MHVLVGGVGELYQGDLDVGRLAVERLRGEPLGGHVSVEDLSYGGVAVAQLLEDLRPDAFIVMGAVRRDRAPGTVERHRIRGSARKDAAAADAVRDAVTGYVGAELLIDVAAALDALPERTVLIDVEPASNHPGESLSAEVADALERMLAMVRLEVGRAPLLAIAAEVRPLVSDGRLSSPAAAAVRELIDDLDGLDLRGAWGSTFRTLNRVRLHVAEGSTGEGMDHLDWALWWSLIEELDRLQAAESGA